MDKEIEKKKRNYKNIKVIVTIVDIVAVLFLIKLCWGLDIMSILSLCFFSSLIILFNASIVNSYKVSIQKTEENDLETTEIKSEEELLEELKEKEKLERKIKNFKIKKLLASIVFIIILFIWLKRIKIVEKKTVYFDGPIFLPEGIEYWFCCFPIMFLSALLIFYYRFSIKLIEIDLKSKITKKETLEKKEEEKENE